MKKKKKISKGVETQPVIAALGRLRQEDVRFEAILCYKVSLKLA